MNGKNRSINDVCFYYLSQEEFYQLPDCVNAYFYFTEEAKNSLYILSFTYYNKKQLFLYNNITFIQKNSTQHKKKPPYSGPP